MPRNYFDFYRLFTEIFNYFGASQVSTTPVSDTFTVLESFTGVNNTSKKLLTSVIDTGEACICRCQWHQRSMYLPVSMTPAKHVTGVVDTGDVMHHWCHWYRAVNITNFVFAGVNDTGKWHFYCFRELHRCQRHRRSMYLPVPMTPAKHVFASVNDTGEACHRCRWHRWRNASPMSLTPANTCFAGVVDTGEAL